MKKDWYAFPTPPADEFLAGFGSAQLFRLPDGKLEIRGGTEQDKAEARDWVRQFMTPPHPLTVMLHATHSTYGDRR